MNLPGFDESEKHLRGPTAVPLKNYNIMFNARIIVILRSQTVDGPGIPEQYFVVSPKRMVVLNQHLIPAEAGIQRLTNKKEIKDTH